MNALILSLSFQWDLHRFCIDSSKWPCVPFCPAMTNQRPVQGRAPAVASGPAEMDSSDPESIREVCGWKGAAVIQQLRSSRQEDNSRRSSHPATKTAALIVQWSQSHLERRQPIKGFVREEASEHFPAGWKGLVTTAFTSSPPSCRRIYFNPSIL